LSLRAENWNLNYNKKKMKGRRGGRRGWERELESNPRILWAYLHAGNGDPLPIATALAGK
jgi:hypothetical protein